MKNIRNVLSAMFLVATLSACSSVQEHFQKVAEDFSNSFSRTNMDMDSGVVCNRSEKDGCIEIDIVAVHENNSPVIQELLGSAPAGKRHAFSDESGVAIRIYKAAESGTVDYYRGCFDVVFDFWGADLSVSEKQMAMYSLPKGQPGRGNNPKIGSVGDFNPGVKAKGSSKKSVRYSSEVCEGKGAIQVPWKFLPKGSFVRIEPIAETTFPMRIGIGKSELFLTPNQLNYPRDKGFAAIVVPIVFR